MPSLLYPGFRFQPISRFLVLPGAWARVSPCRDRLAFARRAYRTAEGEMDIQASPLRSYVLMFLFRFSRAAPGPHPGPLPPSGRGGLLLVGGGFGWLSGEEGELVVFVWGGGGLSFCEGRFASFAVLGPFTNGPYGCRSRCSWTGSAGGVGFAGWDGGGGGSLSGLASPGIPRSPLASRPLTSSTKGAVALPCSSPEPPFDLPLERGKGCGGCGSSRCWLGRLGGFFGCLVVCGLGR